MDELTGLRKMCNFDDFTNFSSSFLWVLEHFEAHISFCFLHFTGYIKVSQLIHQEAVLSGFKGNYSVITSITTSCMIWFFFKF